MTGPAWSVPVQLGCAASGFLGAALYWLYFRYRAGRRRRGLPSGNMMVPLNILVAIPTGRIWLVMPFLPQDRWCGLATWLWEGRVCTAGLVLAAVGALLAGAAIRVVARFLVQNLAVTGADYAAPATLVQDGLYARLRHPGVVANFFLVGGLCLVAGAGVTVALLPVFALILHLTAVIEEREVLRPRFGDRFTRYAAEVPRYVAPQSLAAAAVLVAAAAAGYVLAGAAG